MEGLNAAEAAAPPLGAVQRGDGAERRGHDSGAAALLFGAQRWPEALSDSDMLSLVHAEYAAPPQHS